MTTIVIGDQAEGNKWRSAAAHLKRELKRLHARNNGYMQTWKQVSADTKIHVMLRAGEPVAFIYAGGFDYGIHLSRGITASHASRRPSTMIFKKGNFEADGDPDILFDEIRRAQIPAERNLTPDKVASSYQYSETKGIGAIWRGPQSYDGRHGIVYPQVAVDEHIYVGRTSISIAGWIAYEAVHRGSVVYAVLSGDNLIGARFAPSFNPIQTVKICRLTVAETPSEVVAATVTITSLPPYKTLVVTINSDDGGNRSVSVELPVLPGDGVLNGAPYTIQYASYGVVDAKFAPDLSEVSLLIHGVRSDVEPYATGFSEMGDKQALNRDVFDLIIPLGAGNTSPFCAKGMTSISTYPEAAYGRVDNPTINMFIKQCVEVRKTRTVTIASVTPTSQSRTDIDGGGIAVYVSILISGPGGNSTQTTAVMGGSDALSYITSIATGFTEATADEIESSTTGARNYQDLDGNIYFISWQTFPIKITVGHATGLITTQYNPHGIEYHGYKYQRLETGEISRQFIELLYCDPTVVDGSDNVLRPTYTLTHTLSGGFNITTPTLITGSTAGTPAFEAYSELEALYNESIRTSLAAHNYTNTISQSVALGDTTFELARPAYFIGNTFLSYASGEMVSAPAGFSYTMVTNYEAGKAGAIYANPLETAFFWPKHRTHTVSNPGVIYQGIGFNRPVTEPGVIACYEMGQYSQINAGASILASRTAQFDLIVGNLNTLPEYETLAAEGFSYTYLANLVYHPSIAFEFGYNGVAYLVSRTVSDFIRDPIFILSDNPEALISWMGFVDPIIPFEGVDAISAGTSYLYSGYLTRPAATFADTYGVVAPLDKDRIGVTFTANSDVTAALYSMQFVSDTGRNKVAIFNKTTVGYPFTVLPSVLPDGLPDGAVLLGGVGLSE